MEQRDKRSIELFKENLNLKSENRTLKAEIERLSLNCGRDDDSIPKPPPKPTPQTKKKGRLR